MPLDNISQRIEAVERRIAAACSRAGRARDEVTLIAVTKGFGADVIRQAHAAGLRDFGENRVQEASRKLPALGDLEGVTWHLIGHLQTNKTRPALQLFDIIHSVDSLHLAEELSRRAPHTVPAFIEVSVVGESSKFGVTLEDLPRVYESVSRLANVDVRGLMTVAPLADDAEELRPVFRRLRETADSLNLGGLSMGMTNDFEVAIEEGATHVRVGRAIFGERA
jgi:pyridoxal phosphate enzyme (YggS family)